MGSCFSKLDDGGYSTQTNKLNKDGAVYYE